MRVLWKGYELFLNEMKLIHYFPLYFVVAPQITQEVRNLSVAEELVISFTCKASGNPQPTFYWEKDGKKLSLRRNRFKVLDMPYGSVLRIDPVRHKDSGGYFTCVAENGVGEPVKSTGHLKVYSISREEGNGKTSWLKSCESGAWWSSLPYSPSRDLVFYTLFS